MSRFDVVVFGATGFTGCLVAQYIAKKATSENSGLEWAIAGRNADGLERAKERIQQESGVDVSDLATIVADSLDEDSVTQMVKQTRVVISTVGPYAQYGEKLVAACAQNGVHYCDLTGESFWVRDMIDKYHLAARASKAKIVHSCGFDSIPSDLGCLMMTQKMRDIHGRETKEIKTVVLLKGAASGGTIASMFGIMDYGWKNGMKELFDPYLLNPRDDKPGWDKGTQMSVWYDRDRKTWTMPFVMATGNAHVVRRSNALLQNQYGKPFSYDEVAAVRGFFAPFIALFMTFGLMMFGLLSYIPFTRKFVKRMVPSPGQGPTKEERDAGFFRLLFTAKSATKSANEKPIVLKGRVGASGDPGYKVTACMLAETGLCLAFDQHKLPDMYGCLTPATACGNMLIDRLNTAGLEFSVEDPNEQPKDK